MRIEILDAQGAVTNTILATEEFAEQQHPGAWRLADTQRLWLALIGFTLPDEAEAPSAAS